VNLLECKGGCSATSNNNMKLVHWSLMGSIWYSEGWAGSLSLLPTHQWPVYQSTILLYDGPLLCSFNVPI